MRFTKLLSLTCLLLSTLFIGSCKKETNIINPVQSFIQDVGASQWSVVNSPEYGTGYSITLNAPEITQDVLDAGSVIAYISFNNGNSYESLPEVVKGLTYLVSYTAGTVTVSYFNAYGETDPITPAAATIKVVIQAP